MSFMLFEFSKRISQQYQLNSTSQMATKPTELAKPKFVKVKDLEKERSGYNVIVKIISAERKLVDTKEGEKLAMVDAVVGDQTATAKAFFKGEHAKHIEKDNVVAIRNGVKRFIKDHISLEVDDFGRVTLEKTEINPTQGNNISDAEHKLERKPRGNFENRGNQGRDRGNRRDFDKGARPFRENRGNDRGDRDFDRRREDRGFDPRRQDRRNDRRENYNDRKQDRNYDRPQNRYQGQKDNRNRDNEDRGNFRGNGRRDDRDYDRPQRRGNNYERNADRDYDRRNENSFNDKPPRRQYQEKREEFREKRAPIKWTKIDEISPGDEGLNIIAKVISLKEAGKNLRVTLGDETGLVNAFLREDKCIQIGASIALFNVQAQVHKEHIQVVHGRSQESKKRIQRVNQSLNISDKAWVPIQ